MFYVFYILIRLLRTSQRIPDYGTRTPQHGMRTSLALTLRLYLKERVDWSRSLANERRFPPFNGFTPN